MSLSVCIWLAESECVAMSACLSFCHYRCFCPCLWVWLEEGGGYVSVFISVFLSVSSWPFLIFSLCVCVCTFKSLLVNVGFVFLLLSFRVTLHGLRVTLHGLKNERFENL